MQIRYTTILGIFHATQSPRKIESRESPKKECSHPGNYLTRKHKALYRLNNSVNLSIDWDILKDNP
jgi:hypothetical protein